MLLIELSYIFILVILILVLAFKRQATKLKWGFSFVLTGLAILFIWLVARWEVASVYLRYLFPFFYLIACVISFKRIKKNRKLESRTSTIIGISINTLILFFMSVMCFLALRGYRTPKNSLQLSSPLKNGKYIILHGGSRPMINAHFNVDPQNYALDIVGLNSYGMRASSINGGKNLHNYVIFGKPIYSPCKGKVIAVVDEFDDLIPPKKDIENIAGNYVLIEFNGNEILLAHLKKGSVKVKVGDLVDTNTILGQVGNTGNTSEPHLHLHVESGGEPNTILNGVGIPFKINNNFLVRGDIIDLSEN